MGCGGTEVFTGLVAAFTAGTPVVFAGVPEDTREPVPEDVADGDAGVAIFWVAGAAPPEEICGGTGLDLASEPTVVGPAVVGFEVPVPPVADTPFTGAAVVAPFTGSSGLGGTVGKRWARISTARAAPV